MDAEGTDSESAAPSSFIPWSLLSVWEAALPEDAPGAWIRAAIERQAREAVADSLREADL